MEQMEQTLGSEKTEILSQLYALRAGLSVISIENDATKLAFNRICEIKSSYISKSYEYFSDALVSGNNFAKLEQTAFIYEKCDNIKYAYLTSLTNNTNYNKIERGYARSDMRNMSTNQILEMNNLYFKHKNKIAKEIFLKWWGSDESIEHYQEKNKQLQILFDTKNSELNLMLKSLNSLQGVKFLFLKPAVKKEITETQENINVINKIIKQLNHRIKETQDEINNLNKFEENASAFKDEIKIKKSNCEQLFAALQQEFNPLLDVRDWKHIDLIIFYLETRRADSVKEALQLVDREMQTERIVQTVVLATQQICNTLAIGFTMLNNSMVKCFNQLSAQIAAASAAQSARLARLTESVNLGNALKAKANVASEKLMQDVNEIRNFVCC